MSEFTSIQAVSLDVLVLEELNDRLAHRQPSRGHRDVLLPR